MTNEDLAAIEMHRARLAEHELREALARGDDDEADRLEALVVDCDRRANALLGGGHE